MKIVYFIYDDVDNPWCGGGGAYRNLEIQKILAKEHEITCYTGNYPTAGNHVSHGIRFKRLGTGTNHLLSRVTFSLLANLYCLFVRADIIVSVFSVFAPVFAFLFPQKKVITDFYHYWGWQLLDKYGPLGLLPFIAEKIAIYGSRNIVTISPSVARVILAFVPGKSIVTILSGFDSALLNLRKTGEEHILFLGRMDWYMKGLDILLSAFQQMVAKELKFKAIIAGKATKERAAFVQGKVRQRRLQDYVEVKPNVDNQTKKELLANARLFCTASRFEGWCIAAVEAAACMLPVVGANVSGLKDAVVDGKTGFLVERENTEQLADKIILLNEDATLRRSMGIKGRQWARGFQWRGIAAQYENLMEKCLVKK